MSSSEDDSDSVSSEHSSASEESANDDNSADVPFVPQYITETLNHINIHGGQIEQRINAILEQMKREEESDIETDDTKGLADQVEKLSRKLATVQLKLHTAKKQRGNTLPGDENSARGANPQGRYAGMDSGQAALLERLIALEQRFTSLTGQAANYTAEGRSIGAETDGFELDSQDDLYNIRGALDPRQIEVQRALDAIQKRQNEIQSSSSKPSEI